MQVFIHAWVASTFMPFVSIWKVLIFLDWIKFKFSSNQKFSVLWSMSSGTGSFRTDRFFQNISSCSKTKLAKWHVRPAKFQNILSCSTTKLTKWHVCPTKTQISLGILTVWSESSLSAWRCLGSLSTHRRSVQRRLWSDWVDADQRLRWVHMSFCWFCHAAAHFHSDRCQRNRLFFCMILCNSLRRYCLSLSYANEPRHDKTHKVTVRPAKTQISLGIRPVWSESSLCAQRVAKDQAFFMRTAKTLMRLGGCPGWSESSLGAQPHCLFCHVAAQMSF